MSATSSRKPAWGRTVRWIGTLVSIGLLVFLLERQDWKALSTAARSVGWNGVGLGLLFVAGRQLLNAARWYALIRVHAIALGYLNAARLTFTGLFASNFLPTTVGGDVLRLVGVMEASEDRVVGTTTVFLDRVVGMLGMVALIPFGIPILLGIVSDGVLIASGAALSSRGIVAMVRRGVERLRRAMSLWRRRPSALVASLLYAWLAVACYLMAVWIVARFIGIEVSYWQVAGATSLTYFLTLLPISINGYGLRELGVVAVYTQLGALPEQASALAFITRGLMWAVSLPGMLWLGGLVQSAGQQLAELSAPEGGGE